MMSPTVINLWMQNFYLCSNNFPVLNNQAQQMVSLFRSTYIHESSPSPKDEYCELLYRNWLDNDRL